MIEDISEYPWQTDTSIGDWFYSEGQKYKTATEIIQMLVDIVSKNGNLLLNVVQTPEGDLEEDVIAILKGIGRWMKVNGEAIYGTRPFKVYGEGNSTMSPQEKGPLEAIKMYELMMEQIFAILKRAIKYTRFVCFVRLEI